MRSPAARCYSQNISLSLESKQVLRVAHSSRAPLGPAETTIWRRQSSSREMGKTAPRCVYSFCQCTGSEKIQSQTEVSCMLKSLLLLAITGSHPGSSASQQSSAPGCCCCAAFASESVGGAVLGCAAGRRCSKG